MSNEAGLKYIVGYVPSITAATAMIGIYGVVFMLAVGITSLAWKRGARGRCGCCCCCLPPICHYTVVLPVTAALELFGYWQRRALIVDFGAWPFLFSTLALLIAPVILAVMNYKMVTNLLAAANLRVGCLSPAVLNGLIIAADVVCVVLQFGGTVCATIAIAMSLDAVKLAGNVVILASFILQLVLNIGFTALAWWAHRQPQLHAGASAMPSMGKVWGALWATVALMWVRNVYRAAEGFELAAAGLNGALANEGLFIAFDTVPVLACCLVFCVFHYGLLLPVDKQGLTTVGASDVSPASFV